MKRILPIILSLLLLAGCGGQSGVATGGDLPAPATAVASSGDLSSVDALRTLLLSGGGAWRSDQQDSADAGFTVRELNLRPDGSFTYREGDFASEFCWFASGTWTLEGDALRFVFVQTDEFGTPVSDAEETARYIAASEDEGLRLTLSGETGFCTDASGLNVHYYHPIS